LKRAIQRLIQDPLAMKLLDGEVQAGDHLEVEGDLGAQKMQFKVVRSAKKTAVGESETASVQPKQKRGR
jgi:hypothetical protein